MNRLFLLPLLSLIFNSCGEAPKSIDSEFDKVFTFERTYIYPGNPEFVYDHLTGDISDWWDHSFSENPSRMYIDARPGGGFYEIFDASGDGVLHATVIGAQRGKMLRMEGALGLAGQALTMITTYQLQAKGVDSTVMELRIHGAGEVQKDIPKIVEGVWHHFLGEQFTPYIEKQYSESTSAKE